MRGDDVIIEVRDWRYERVGQIMQRDLTLAATVLFNNVGEWTLTLGKEHHLVPTLRTPGSGIVITGSDGTVLLSGPVTSPSFAATPEDFEGTVTFTGVTDDVILQDRLAYADPTNEDVTQQQTAHDIRSGPAETLIHDYVNVNVGPLAAGSRRHPFLSMGGNGTRGPVLSKKARFPVLGTLLTEICADTRLGFRVRQGPGAGLVFETFEARDQTQLTRLSIKNDGLAGLRTTVAAPQFTRAILGGQGEQEDRLFHEANNEASLSAEVEWGRRIEKFVNASSGGEGEDEEALEQQGIEALAEGAATSVTVELIPAEDSSLIFGTDWGLGDRVTSEVDGNLTVEAFVAGYAFKASAEEGFIFGVVLSESLTTPKPAEKQVEERLSYLERNDAGSGGTAPAPTGLTFTFTTASTEWLCVHNFASSQVTVTCYDASGTEVIGDVSTVNANTVRVAWFYPTSGSCRISK